MSSYFTWRPRKQNQFVKVCENSDVIQLVLVGKPDEIKWESFVSCLHPFHESLSHGRCQYDFPCGGRGESQKIYLRAYV
jgi:hypothetical protein